MKSKLVPTAIALVILGVAIAFLSPWTQNAEAAQVGEEAPDFTLKTLDGDEVSLDDITKAGGGYIVFFTTTCPHCIKEIPHLNELKAEAGKQDKPLPIYGVNPGQPERSVKRFVKQKDVKYPVLYDGDQQVARAYKIVGVPTIVGIGEDGKIKYYAHRMVKDLETAREVLEKGVEG